MVTITASYSGAFDAYHGGEGDDTVYGGDDAIHDYLYGNEGNDILIGTASDRYYGGADADTFVFENYDAYSNDKSYVYDYSSAEGDKLDISDLLSGIYDSAADDINDFVWFTENKGDSILRVDTTGQHSNQSQKIIARFVGETTLDDITDVQTLIDAGTLIV